MDLYGKAVRHTEALLIWPLDALSRLIDATRARTVNKRPIWKSLEIKNFDSCFTDQCNLAISRYPMTNM
jgi:hypothetical protein